MSRSGYLVLEHAIDEIELGFSFRRDLGDLDELVESIRRTGGLLVPISITPQNVLIAGERRLAALRILEYRVAPVWVVTGVSDKLATVLSGVIDRDALLVEPDGQQIQCVNGPAPGRTARHQVRHWRPIHQEVGPVVRAGAEQG